jgi:uncharacterized membrane protein
MNIFFKILLLVFSIDAIFIYNIKDRFNKQILAVQGSDININYLGTVLSYVFIVLQLYWFIIKDDKSVFDAFILGLSLYGVYEFTNLALLKNWGIELALIDTVWGGLLFAITTYLLKNNLIFTDKQLPVY